VRVPRDLPPDLRPDLAEKVIATAISWRDKSLLTLLYRSGQRIGDWCEGRGHGVLGMRLSDFDESSGTIVVRLKGARHEHRVPVTDDFWSLFHRYLADERDNPRTQAAWVALRKGGGRPLTYSAFESSLRYIGKKLDVNVSAHMFRHTVARAVVEVAGLKAAQELLGHAHITTTADVYARVDIAAMIKALENARAAAPRRTQGGPASPTSSERYVFAYDDDTIEELDAVASPDDGEALEP
jgi:integrase